MNDFFSQKCFCCFIKLSSMTCSVDQCCGFSIMVMINFYHLGKCSNSTTRIKEPCRANQTNNILFVTEYPCFSQNQMHWTLIFVILWNFVYCEMLGVLIHINNIRRKWRLGAQRQLYNWGTTQPLQDGTTPVASSIHNPATSPRPNARTNKTK